MHRSGVPPLLDALTTAWLRKLTGKSGQAVADWKNGKISTARLLEISEAVRALLAETKEAPPPQWATGLVEDVPAIRAVVESNADELAALRAVLEAIESQLLPPADDPVDDPPPQPTESRLDQ